MKTVIIFIKVLSTLLLSSSTECSRIKRFAIRGPKWDHTDLTWNLVNTLPKLGSESEIKNALTTAMGYWTKHSVITFTEKKSNDADIQISFQRGKHNDVEPFNGPGLILAHAFYPGSGIGGDIHIDADEDWNLKSFTGVIVHELGHSLGLSHSSDEEASMYAWYRGGKTDITQDDINGIKTIYPYPVKKQVLNTMQTLKKPLTFYPTLIEYIPKNLSPPPPPPPSTAKTTTTTATKMLHQLPQMSATNPSKPFVDKCKMAYDAVAVLRGELFIFKDKYFWRLGRDERVDKQLYNTNSFRIRSIWSSLPENLEKIDSVYQNKNGEIVFFINLSIYVFNENILVKIAPLKDISRVDGIFIWHEKTYIFSGSYFWLFDESTLRVDKQFTRKIKHIWKGVPSSGIDSVFQYTNGKTYFFKGLFYWEFNDRTMAVVGKPMLSSQQWMRCSQVLVLPRMREQQQQHHRHQHQRHHHQQQQSIHKKRLLQLREMQRHKQVQQQQKMQRHKQIQQRQQIHRQQQIQQKRKQKYYLQLNGQQQWKQQQQQPKQQQQLLQWQQRQSMYTKPIKNRAFAPSTVNKHSTCLQNGYSKFLTTNICRQQLQPNYIRQFQQR